MKTTKSKPKKNHVKSRTPSTAPPQKLPFIAHIHELRRRLFYITIAVIAGGVAAYSVQMHISKLLLRPAGDQQFIYTTPGGGFDFLFRLCLYSGILVAIPVIVYQLLRYLQPLIKKDATRFIAWGSVASGFLAIIGIAFGYLVGLPASMQFLLHQFSTEQIHALLSIQSYLSFVMVYLLGSALLFQVPLIMLLINKAKPLKPSKLMRFQRWFIVFAFIVGAIINPSPNIQDQLLLSVPMILMYQVGIVLVWIANRKHRKSEKVSELLRKDAEAREARLSNFQQAQETWLKAVETTVKQASPPAIPKRAVVAPTTPPRPKPVVPAAPTVTAPPAATAAPAPVQPPAPITIIRPTRPARDAMPALQPPAPPYRSIAISVQD